ncbi:GntR family transcriptional regulator [Aquimarina sediminis]|uniref:GntR family transcriptional regulator n=1 Tax=Aquimarina sediminis TaxID=2070536 RepID=UPI000CA064AA|nr:GntR family transcriptional regulator [Aquimarina sediminis]
MKLISIEENLGLAKYKQIVLSIEKGLLDGVLKKGDKLPSINSIKNKFSVSRDTVLMAYSELKTRGIVQSIPGKGYYLKSENIDTIHKVFLLFDELNVFKEDLYNSFLNKLPDNVQVDIYFHHFNYDVFSKLIYDNIGNYNSYVIMPANLKNTKTVIEKLPSEKVYILDQTNEELLEYQTIFQNFEKDIFNNLIKSINRIKQYECLILLFQDDKQPEGMLVGFNKFCKVSNVDNEVVDSLESIAPQKGDVYIIPDDRNLIEIIQKAKKEKLVIGKDIGIIAYNDTLLKEVVEGGITTITTDFKYMGAQLAQMIFNKEHSRIENPNSLIIRSSL